MTADRPLTRREIRERERVLEPPSAPVQVVPSQAAEATPSAVERPAVERPAVEVPAVEVPAVEVPADRGELEGGQAVTHSPVAPPTPSRRALRSVAEELETTVERSAIRRRPVQAPTTTGITVVDPHTGAISAIDLPPAPGAGQSEPDRPEPGEPGGRAASRAASEGEPGSGVPVAPPSPVAPPVAPPNPVSPPPPAAQERPSWLLVRPEGGREASSGEPGPDAPVAPPLPVTPPNRVSPPPPAAQEPSWLAEPGLQRRSVMGRDELPAAAVTRAGAVPEAAAPSPSWSFGSEPEVLSVEEAALRDAAGRSVLATILTFLVLLVAGFVIGFLIWTVADDAAGAQAASAVPQWGAS